LFLVTIQAPRPPFNLSLSSAQAQSWASCWCLTLVFLIWRYRTDRSIRPNVLSLDPLIRWPRPHRAAQGSTGQAFPLAKLSSSSNLSLRVVCNNPEDSHDSRLSRRSLNLTRSNDGDELTKESSIASSRGLNPAKALSKQQQQHAPWATTSLGHHSFWPSTTSLTESIYINTIIFIRDR
jgi:hypothetical protein